MPKGTKKYNDCQENILIAAIIKVINFSYNGCTCIFAVVYKRTISCWCLENNQYMNRKSYNPGLIQILVFW